MLFEVTRYDTIRNAIVTIGVARIFDWGGSCKFSPKPNKVNGENLQEKSKILATPMVTNAQEAQQKKKKNTASMQADKNTSAEKMSC